MLSALKAYIIRRRLRQAESDRHAKLCAWADAKIRGDTRAQHETHRAYVNATSAVVRLEIQLSRVGGGVCPPKRRAPGFSSAWRGAR